MTNLINELKPGTLWRLKKHPFNKNHPDYGMRNDLNKQDLFNLVLKAGLGSSPDHYIELDNLVFIMKTTKDIKDYNYKVFVMVDGKYEEEYLYDSDFIDEYWERIV